MNTSYPIVLMALTSNTSVYPCVYITIDVPIHDIYIYAMFVSMLEIPSTMLFSFRVLKAMGGEGFPCYVHDGVMGWMDR
jgi:hypothetical protein